MGCCLLLVSAAAACVAEPEGIRRLTDSGAVDPGSGGAGGASLMTVDGCEAAQLLEDRCGRCHGDPIAHGAPFSFVTSEDRERVDAKGVTRRERMAQAIERGDMPALFIELEPPVQGLSDEERDTLLRWLRASNVPDEPAACD